MRPPCHIERQHVLLLRPFGDLAIHDVAAIVGKRPGARKAPWPWTAILTLGAWPCHRAGWVLDCSEEPVAGDQAARIVSLAEGGEILVGTRPRTRGTVVRGLDGLEVRLKGIASPVEVVAIDWRAASGPP